MASAASASDPGEGGTQRPEVSPAGAGGYVVKPGDTMSSIADAHGFFWETVWNDPANEGLRRARDNPEVLLPGDRVTIPEKRAAKSTCETARRHVFRRRGIPVKLLLRTVGPDGQPLCNKRYSIVVGETSYAGTTDAEGGLLQWVMPSVRAGSLTVYLSEEPDSPTLKWPLSFGTLDPAGTERGARSRLRNLGYDCGAEGDAEKLATALRQFQAERGIGESGAMDAPTIAALQQAFGA